MALRIAEKVVSITDKLEIPYVFKGSFKKANRSRVDSFTGIGDEKALKILRKVSETFDTPTVTDIHEVSDASRAAQYVDVLQKIIKQNNLKDFDDAKLLPSSIELESLIQSFITTN